MRVDKVVNGENVKAWRMSTQYLLLPEKGIQLDLATLVKLRQVLVPEVYRLVRSNLAARPRDRRHILQ